jgi:DNA-binding XRE family transcriptional regulator
MARMSDVAQSSQLRQLIDSGRAKELRITAGDTLAVAGRAVEVDPAAVFRWERGERKPRGRNVRAYHRYLMRLKTAQQSSGGEAA